MSENFSVFHFDDPVEFVIKQFTIKKEKNPRFSLRAWSKQLGFQNPSMISSVMKGERRLQTDLCEKIGKNLKLSIPEQKYFKILVLQKNAKNDEERAVYSEMLIKARPSSALVKRDVDLDAFRFISDWYHVAILEMLELKDFQYDYDYIANRLGKGLTKELVKIAIERLIRLGLVEEAKLRKILRRTNGNIVVDKNIPSEIIRNHHAQFLDLAKASITNQSFEERDIRGSTLAIRKEDFKTIQEILRKAHSDIIALSCDKNGNDVYHFSTQFFKLTENK